MKVVNKSAKGNEKTRGIIDKFFEKNSKIIAATGLVSVCYFIVKHDIEFKRAHPLFTERAVVSNVERIAGDIEVAYSGDIPMTYTEPDKFKLTLHFQGKDIPRLNYISRNPIKENQGVEVAMRRIDKIVYDKQKNPTQTNTTYKIENVKAN